MVLDRGDGTLLAPVDLLTVGDLALLIGHHDGLGAVGLGSLVVLLGVVVALELSLGVVSVGAGTEGGLGVQGGHLLGLLHVGDEGLEALGLLLLGGVAAAVLDLELSEHLVVVHGGGGGADGGQGSDDEGAHSGVKVFFFSVGQKKETII